MTHAEITKAAFKVLINSDLNTDMVKQVETDEHARKYYFEAHGVMLVEVENFLSNVTQYFIQDINA